MILTLARTSDLWPLSRPHASWGVSSIGPTGSFDFIMEIISLGLATGRIGLGIGAEGGGSFHLPLAIATMHRNRVRRPIQYLKTINISQSTAVVVESISMSSAFRFARFSTGVSSFVGSSAFLLLPGSPFIC